MKRRIKREWNRSIGSDNDRGLSKIYDSYKLQIQEFRDYQAGEMQEITTPTHIIPKLQETKDNLGRNQIVFIIAKNWNIPTCPFIYK